MNNLKLALKGTGILGLGVFTLIWYIIKLISCIMIASLISIRLGLTGYYWFFATILLLSVLGKIVFYGNTGDTYSKLADEYAEETKEYDEVDVE